MPARACTGRGALGAYFAMEAQLARLASLGLVDVTEHRDRNLTSCYSRTRTWSDIAVTALVWIGAVGRGALSGSIADGMSASSRALQEVEIERPW